VNDKRRKKLDGIAQRADVNLRTLLESLSEELDAVHREEVNAYNTHSSPRLNPHPAVLAGCGFVFSPPGEHTVTANSRRHDNSSARSATVIPSLPRSTPGVRAALYPADRPYNWR